MLISQNPLQLSGHCISYAFRGPPSHAITLQSTNVRASRRALDARTSRNEANGVQSLAPTKKTVVTGLAGLPIGKEICLLKADWPPAALPVPTMERIVTGSCRNAGGQNDLASPSEELFNAFSRDGFALKKLRATLFRALLCLLCPCLSQ